ncbi:MAG: hypothetical protein U9Q85_02875 [Patescibacteria group bacterium]|nr:hypothetical protein [Patescibacteria group bacterium]
MRKATLNQVVKILSIFDDTPVEQIQEILGSGFLEDIRDADIKEVNRSLFRKMLGLKPLHVTKDKLFLRLISDESLAVKATDKKRIIAEANDVFKWVDPDFKNWGADEVGSETDKIPTYMYEMEKNGKFQELFGSIGDIKKICFTQEQIISFVEKRNRFWTDRYAIFFLFRSKNTNFENTPLGEFFVACVSMVSVGLYVYVRQLQDSYVWDSGRRHRVVVPQ